MKKELIENLDYKSVPASAGAKPKTQKDQYLISYDGLKQLEMKCNK